jgi:glyoxylase-like metal-dependent hydrolase (beta-lactamase superfamily II)
MTPATKLQELNSALCGWASFHTQWKIDFNSYALQTSKGVVFIDPMTPAPPVLKQLELLGEPIAIVLTNAHHDRDADWFRKKYEIQIYAHEKAQSDCDTKIDLLIIDGEKLPGGLKAIHLPGSTDSEIALYLKTAGGIVLIGDALLNPPGKGLKLLDDQYIEDRKQALQSLRKLAELDFKIATFAHGDPLIGDAQQKIAGFLKQQRARK